MKALTLTQPWCALVASGIKLVENRPQRPPLAMIGQRFAIHASRERLDEVYARIFEIAPEIEPPNMTAPLGSAPMPPWWRMSRVTSAVIGSAVLDRVVGGKTPNDYNVGLAEIEVDQRRWFFGPIGYILRDAVALPEPVPCKGALGFWQLSDEVAAKVIAQS